MRRVLAIVALGSLAACDGSVTPPPGAGGIPGDPVEVPDAPGPCPLALRELAAYQTVRVPLGSGDGAALPPGPGLIASKGALVRAAFAALPAGAGQSARARLTVVAGGQTRVIEQTRTIEADSSEAVLESTFNFDLEPGEVRGDTTVRVEALGFSGCRTSPDGRLPQQGSIALAARPGGTLKVWLLPIRYDTDGSGRLPDISPQQLARYHDLLMAMYPVEAVELTVREPVGSTIDLNAGGWGKLLDTLRGQRAADRVPDDVYFYGLVSPADTFRSYCRGGCVEGISYLSDGARSALRVGAGIGFVGDEAANTIAHEIGHQHGRGHAPCQVRDGLDLRYPHQGGVIGVWGFDSRTRILLDPARTRDIMSYCRPTWISDHNYQALFEQRSGMGRPLARRFTIANDGWSVLLSDGHGQLTWGAPAGPELDRDAGTPVEAAVLGAAGEPITNVDLVRVPLADDPGAMYLVPPPRPTWHALVLPGSRPIRFER